MGKKKKRAAGEKISGPRAARTHRHARRATAALESRDEEVSVPSHGQTLFSNGPGRASICGLGSDVIRRPLSLCSRDDVCAERERDASAGGQKLI